MKVDRSILGRARVLFARYRFYSRGSVPQDSESWARSQLTSGRWMRIHLLIELCWLVVFVAVMLAVGGDTTPFVVAAFTAVFGVMSLFWAVRYRKRALLGMAGPPAREVLKQIGEPVPPRY